MTTAIARRAPPALPDTYHPGVARRVTDAEHEAVSAFVARYPEYARLSNTELATLAATYRGPEREAEVAELEDAGVPLDWHRQYDEEDLG